MEQQVAFKTSFFGGFDKKSVLKYIDELSAENKAALDGLNQKIAEMEQCRDSLNETVTGLNKQVEGMQRTLEQREARVQSLQETVEGLNSEIERQQTIAEDKERELRAQQEKCRQLTLRAESLEYKGKKYDEAMCRIGDAFMEAKQSADVIVKAAEQKASQLTITALESIQSLAQQIDVFKGDVIALRATVQNSLADLEQRLDAIDGSIDVLDKAVKSADRVRVQEMEAADRNPDGELWEDARQIEPIAAEAATGEEAAAPLEGPKQTPPEKKNASAAVGTEFFW